MNMTGCLLLFTLKKSGDFRPGDVVESDGLSAIARKLRRKQLSEALVMKSEIDSK